MNDEQLAAYLARIGAQRPARADAESLRELHERHLYSVPFENLSIHLGEQIVLAEKALLDKIVRRRRGGFCYELNGAFAALLTALGFDVTLLAAKVYLPDGKLGPPFDHLALRVDLDDFGSSGPAAKSENPEVATTPRTSGRPRPPDGGWPNRKESWLADVGFGAHARRPLRIAPEPQPDVEGAFSVHETADGDLQVRNGDRPVYLAEARPRELSEFKPTCWWQATSPESHFTGFLTCSLPQPGGGRVTLAGSKLYETLDGNRTETELSDEEVLATYRDRFGVELDTLPVLLHPR